MAGATNNSSGELRVDPTMGTLVPAEHYGRNLLAFVVVLLVLAGAWMSDGVLEMSIVPDQAGLGSSWSAVPLGGQVLTVSTISPDGWPSFSVEEVGDTSGAEVVGAWILPTNQASDAVAGQSLSGVEYVRRYFPGQAIDASTALPFTVAAGEDQLLVIMWAITNCEALQVGEPVTVELRSKLGTSTSEELSKFSRPAAFFDTLVDTGICPA